MSLTKVFTDTLTRLTSIKVKPGSSTFVPNPKVSNNFSKTVSNTNDIFKYINIWDEQIDNLIKGDSYPLKSEGSIFIEFVPGEPKMLLNKVSSYPDAKIIFHIFSYFLNAGDSMEQNLKIYEYRDILKSNTLGWSPTNCSSFMSIMDKLDYKHGNITKYILGYNFNFTDYSGSIYDCNSQNYLNFKKILGLTLNSVSIFQNWESGVSYGAYSSAVINGNRKRIFNDDFNNDFDKIPKLNYIPNVFLCINSNSDLIFSQSNWILIFEWVSKKNYPSGAYVYIYNHIYKCSTANNDNIFIPGNWEIIA